MVFDIKEGKPMQKKSTVYSRYLEFQGTEQNMSSYQ